jgi:hypothetical protein
MHCAAQIPATAGSRNSNHWIGKSPTPPDVYVTEQLY